MDLARICSRSRLEPVAVRDSARCVPRQATSDSKDKCRDSHPTALQLAPVVADPLSGTAGIRSAPLAARRPAPRRAAPRLPARRGLRLLREPGPHALRERAGGLALRAPGE